MRALAVFRGTVSRVLFPRRAFLTVPCGHLVERLTPRDVEIDGEPVRLYARWFAGPSGPQLAPEDVLGLAAYVEPEEESAA